MALDGSVGHAHTRSPPDQHGQGVAMSFVGPMQKL